MQAALDGVGAVAIEGYAGPQQQAAAALLRNVAERAPYMHAGQLSTLGDVIRHYNQAPAAPAGHTELKPLRLTNAEMRQIEAFLGTLSGGTSGN